MSIKANVNTLAVSVPDGGEIVLVQPGHNAPLHILVYTENLQGVDLPKGADTIPPEILCQMIQTYVDQKKAEIAAGTAPADTVTDGA